MPQGRAFNREWSASIGLTIPPGSCGLPSIRARLGKILQADAYVKWYRSDAYYSRPIKGSWITEGGGALINQAIHQVDVLVWLIGPISEVFGYWQLGALHRIESEDVISAVMKYAGGQNGVIQASTAFWPGYTERIEIHGTKGTAILSGDKLTTWDVEDDTGDEAPVDREVASGSSDPMAISLAPFERQFLDFGESIRTGRKPISSGEDGYRALEVVQSIYQSCRQGLPLSSVPSLRVPASSANLGPGFDALGTGAGDLSRLPLRACPRTADHRLGPGCKLHLHRRRQSDLADRSGCGQDVGSELPLIALEIVNDIPIGKGLGSSAAALTAGVVIADHLLKLHWKPLRILDEAAQIEGHPTMWRPVYWAPSSPPRWSEAERPGQFAWSCRPAMVLRSWCPILYCPPPKRARFCRMCTPREDTIFNVQRSALLIAALATGTTAAFPAALEDRLHQPYRARLVPGLDEIVRLRAPGLLGCALSGAGPSVLVFYEKGYESVTGLIRQLFAIHGHQSEVLWPDIAQAGYQLTDESLKT